ncbi:hypothetical protein [Methanothrix soehngenii]|uniref:hypothetical protein n=1 Tax=Methanothrix soehngenii TaxID=2223 RepID=UPI00300CEAB3
MKAAEVLPDARREGPGAGAARPMMLKAEAEAKGAARLEDLNLWQMEKTKTTKKGTQIILLLDGLMERGREGPACPPGELQEGGSRDRPAEGPEGEG